MVQSSAPALLLVLLYSVGMPACGLYLLYKLVQEFRALRNSLDEVRDALKQALLEKRL
jgi:hypothetical protein